MFQQPDLFAGATPASNSQNIAELIERITASSKRPRYAFLVLNLIVDAAGQGESAGPYVQVGAQRHPIRDWLCDALMPLAQKGTRRQTIAEKVQADLRAEGLLPDNPEDAGILVDKEVRRHVRRSARCNVSTAVSDLVRAGLLRRHYQGFRVDHHNRGAQREAVYTLTSEARNAFPHRAH
ncbi:MAG TPA: hypothetical protein VF475_01915 [Sphingobium sp.]